MSSMRGASRGGADRGLPLWEERRDGDRNHRVPGRSAGATMGLRVREGGPVRSICCSPCCATRIDRRGAHLPRAR